MNSCAVLMNAHRANRFQLRATTFYFRSLQLSSREIVMAALGFRRHINGCRLAVGNCGFGVARPRRRSGHRWRFPQLAMAVVVYGASALVVGAGLIGAEKRPN
jgi:hypothetical protein